MLHDGSMALLALPLLLLASGSSGADDQPAAAAAAGLRYSACWGCDPEHGGDGWTNLLFDSANLTLIDLSATGRYRALYKWEAYAVPRASAFDGVHCHSPLDRFGNSTGCVTLSATYEQEWAALHTTLKPHIASGAIVGIMLGDERMWDGISMANLTRLTRTIRASWPAAILFINEAQDLALCGMNRLNESLFDDSGDGPQCWPPDLDWIGFDLYDMTVADGGTAFSQLNVSRRGVEDYVYPRFASHHRIVPTTLGFGYNSNGCNASNCSSFVYPAPPRPSCNCNATYDKYCADNAFAFEAWGRQDPWVAAVLPFFWYSEHGSVGLEGMPLCKAAWTTIGKRILAHAAATPPPPPAARGHTCAGRLAPGTPDPAKALIMPGSRDWCSRHNNPLTTQSRLKVDDEQDAAAAAGGSSDSKRLEPVLPDVSGLWVTTAGDSASGEQRNMTLRRHQPSPAAAAPPNGVYAQQCGAVPCGHCWLTPMYDYDTRQLQRIAVHCDGGGGAAGEVATSTTLTLDGESWTRVRQHDAQLTEGNVTSIHTVHMVFMNHYDAGYDGYINDVNNEYMHKYFPLAATVANSLKGNSSTSDRLIYTTHPWLVQSFLQCPCPEPLPPPPTEPMSLSGVWTGSTGAASSARFFISPLGKGNFSVQCLTFNVIDRGGAAGKASGCPWDTGNCIISNSNSNSSSSNNSSQATPSISCKMDNGKSMDGKVSATLDAVAFPAAESSFGWLKFTGELSGLWQDGHATIVIGHNASSSSISAWWDTALSGPGKWSHSTAGSIANGTVSLKLRGTRSNPTLTKTGTVGSNFTSLSFGWHAGSQCYHGLTCPSGWSICPARTLWNHFAKPLQCPSEADIAAFDTSVRAGDIAYHAGPMNWQPENMGPHLFQAGLDIAKRLDQRYASSDGGGEKARKNATTMSIRDVMYVTRAVIPHLAVNGITGLTVGSNGACYPPQVPKLHRWVDRATGTDVMVAYHPFGYGGYGPTDCAESPNGVALCSEFRMDNSGPPTSTAEVQSSLAKLRAEYPGATVKASTFDAFFEDVQPAKSQLPVVDLEIGEKTTKSSHFPLAQSA